MFDKQYLGYLENEDLLLVVKSINLTTQELTLVGDSKEVVRKISEVKLLPEIGEINGVQIFNHDVLQRKDGRLIEVELQEDGKVVFHVLNNKLEREKSSNPVNPEEKFKQISAIKSVELLANIYALEVVEEYDFDFNIKIVKDDSNTYYYACNNKEEKEIDLIKVIFIGTQLIEEKYERLTVPYEEFEDMVNDNVITEVSPHQLQQYAINKMSNSVYTEDGYEVEYADCDCEDYDEEVEEDLEKEPICDVCEKYEEDCDCSPW